MRKTILYFAVVIFFIFAVAFLSFSPADSLNYETFFRLVFFRVSPDPTSLKNTRLHEFRNSGNDTGKLVVEKNSDAIQSVKVGGIVIKVDLANTLELHTQGLSGRSELQENAGMLFIFERAGLYPFWMKDMNFAIDIVWIGEDKRVVYIKKNALPESYPESFVPARDALYVLEVVAGFSDENNLKEGDRVEFVY